MKSAHNKRVQPTLGNPRAAARVALAMKNPKILVVVSIAFPGAVLGYLEYRHHQFVHDLMRVEMTASSAHIEPVPHSARSVQQLVVSYSYRAAKKDYERTSVVSLSSGNSKSTIGPAYELVDEVLKTGKFLGWVSRSNPQKVAWFPREFLHPFVYFMILAPAVFGLLVGLLGILSLREANKRLQPIAREDARSG